ncbi:hypothetical protein BKA93DRAFT_692882, partial [Sparassis latifolia]
LLRSSSLHGFHIPGVPDRLITTLFADDTTVYLAESDDFHTLQQILDLWCIAAKAKFNVHKTEIIPIGNPEYRTELITSRKIHPTALPFPSNTHIAKDGEAIRILGGWIGNHVEPTTQWPMVIEKIQAALTRWNKSHPSLKGRRLIVQMIVGGMTQFLTTVQGMPKHIEKSLISIIRKFI